MAFKPFGARECCFHCGGSSGRGDDRWHLETSLRLIVHRKRRAPLQACTEAPHL